MIGVIKNLRFRVSTFHSTIPKLRSVTASASKRRDHWCAVVSFAGLPKKLLERRAQRHDIFRAIRQNAQEIVIVVDPGAEKLRSGRTRVRLPRSPVCPGLPRRPCWLIICQPSPGQIPGLSRLATKTAPPQATMSSLA
jgi:hypothetical protein